MNFLLTVYLFINTQFFLTKHSLYPAPVFHFGPIINWDRGWIGINPGRNQARSAFCWLFRLLAVCLRCCCRMDLVCSRVVCISSPPVRKHPGWAEVMHLCCCCCSQSAPHTYSMEAGYGQLLFPWLFSWIPNGHLRRRICRVLLRGIVSSCMMS